MKSIVEKRESVIMWAAVGLIIISYLLTALLFRYIDTVSFTAWSVGFWDCLFEGKLNEFYSYTVLNLRGAEQGVVEGSWLTFFPWILWNFPVYLTHTSPANMQVDSMTCVLWAKLFLLLCVFGIAFYAYKIVLFVSKGDQKSAFIAAILASGGGELLNCVAYVGQDEIVYLLCLMIAIYCVLKGKRRVFLFWGMVAVTICPIMLLPFIAIVLYFEKNILKDIFYVGVAGVPSVLFEVVYRNDEMYQAVKDTNTIGVLNQMMNGELLSTTFGAVSIAGVALVILFFICYIRNSEQEETENILYYIAIVFFIICFLMPQNMFYRFCLYVPFWSIMLVLKGSNRNMRIFLFTLISYLRVFIVLGYNGYQNMNAKYLMPQILLNLKSRIRIRSIIEMIDDLKYYDTFLMLIRPILLGAAAIILFDCCLGIRKKIDFKLPYQVSMLVYAGCGILLLGAFGIGVFH